MQKPAASSGTTFVFVTAVIVVLVVGAAIAFRVKLEQDKERALWQGLNEIEQLVERYRLHSDEQNLPGAGLPDDIRTAMAWDPSFVLPVNPYTGKPMAELTEEGPRELGNFTYFRVYQVSSTPEGQVRELVDHHLVGYSPQRQRRLADGSPAGPLDYQPYDSYLDLKNATLALARHTSFAAVRAALEAAEEAALQNAQPGGHPVVTLEIVP